MFYYFEAIKKDFTHSSIQLAPLNIIDTSMEMLEKYRYWIISNNCFPDLILLTDFYTFTYTDSVDVRC